MKVCGFGNVLFTITEHFPIDCRIQGETTDGTTQIIIDFTRHVYIIEKFKTKILIKNDVFGPELIIPDVGKEKFIIGSCKNMTVKFNVKKVGPPIKRVVRSSGIIKISAKFNSNIFFRLRGNLPVACRTGFHIHI